MSTLQLGGFPGYVVEIPEPESTAETVLFAMRFLELVKKRDELARSADSASADIPDKA